MDKRNSDHRVIKVTLSGSFHKDPAGLDRDYRELVRNQCQVLSPRTLDFEDATTLFVRNQVERQDSVSQIQNFHFQAIALSDFLWLHAPNGYIGLSSAMEIGYAYAKGIRVFANETLLDETLKQYVRIVPSVFSAIEQMRA